MGCDLIADAAGEVVFDLLAEAVLKYYSLLHL
jgi:hypothetical protein